MAKDRMPQVNSLLREEISKIVLTELQDPRLHGVTVTGVDVAPDLSQAKVYVTLLLVKGEPTEEERNEYIEVLEGTKGAVRKILGSRIRLRKTPELTFKYDLSTLEGKKIERYLKELGL